MSLKEVGLRLKGVDVWLIDIYKDGDMGVIGMFKKRQPVTVTDAFISLISIRI